MECRGSIRVILPGDMAYAAFCAARERKGIHDAKAVRTDQPIPGARALDPVRGPGYPGGG
jgi:hypothetical protein